jgi:hypothetical protein
LRSVEEKVSDSSPDPVLMVALHELAQESKKNLKRANLELFWPNSFFVNALELSIDLSAY